MCKPGVLVHWKDPDEGKCSGIYSIIATRGKGEDTILSLKSDAFDSESEAEAFLNEVELEWDVCEMCNAAVEEGSTRYIGNLHECVCKSCEEDYLSNKVNELISDYSPSEVIKEVMSYVAGLVDNVHDTSKAGHIEGMLGLMDGELTELACDRVVPMLESPLQMAVDILDAAAKGLEMNGY